MGKVTATNWYRSGRKDGVNKFEGRKGLIARAARTCFGRKGVAKTSIADITREVDITRELFYYYYPNKDAVVRAVLEGYITDARVKLVKALDEAEDEPATLLQQTVGSLHAWMSTDDTMPVPMVDVLHESGVWTKALYRVSGEALEVLNGTTLLPDVDTLSEMALNGCRMGLVGALSALQCDETISEAAAAQSIAPLFP